MWTHVLWAMAKRVGFVLCWQSKRQASLLFHIFFFLNDFPAISGVL